MALVWEYDYVTTLDGSLIKDNEGKYVVLDAWQVEGTDVGGGNFRFKPVPKNYFYELIGYKIIPIIFTYDILYKILLELTLDIIGVKDVAVTKSTKVNGNVLFLKNILYQLFSTKVAGTSVNKELQGKKIYDAVIEVGLDAIKLKSIENLKSIDGKKDNLKTFSQKLIAHKLSLVDIAKKIHANKKLIKNFNYPLDGEKLYQFINEILLEGKIDYKGLLYLLFDDEIDIENLTKGKIDKNKFIIMLDDINESEV